MSIEENKALVRRVYEFCNKKDMAALFNLYAREYVAHLTTGDMSLEQGKQFDAMWSTAFPDAKVVIEHMVAEGDKVAVRVTWRGTHQGEFMGIAPTGNKIEITNTGIYRTADDKLAEYWGTGDTLRLMQQLGAIPSQ